MMSFRVWISRNGIVTEILLQELFEIRIVVTMVIRRENVQKLRCFDLGKDSGQIASVKIVKLVRGHTGAKSRSNDRTS